MRIKELRQYSLTAPAIDWTGWKWFMLSFFLAALSLSSAAQAQNKKFTPVIVGKASEGGLIGPHIIVQKDKTGKVTPQSIRDTQGAVLAGSMSQDNMINLGVEGASHWLAFKLLNKDGNPDWVFDVGRMIEGRTGQIRSFKIYEMPLPYPGATTKPAFYLNDITSTRFDGYNKVKIQPGTQKLIILHIVPTAGMVSLIAPQIHSDEEMMGLLYSNAIADMIYAAILIAFATYAAVLAFFHQRASTLAFSLYFGLIATSYLLHQNDGTDMTAGYFKFFAAVFGLAHAIVALWTVKIFCNINQSRITERYILYGLMAISTFAAIIAFAIPLPGGLLQTSITQGIPFAVYLVVTLVAYAQRMSRNIRSYDYFLSWLFVLAGFTTTVLAGQGIVSTTPVTVNALWLSFIPQGVLTCFALSKAMDTNENETQVAQNIEVSETLNLKKLKQTRDEGDHSRLLRVIEKERELLTDLKQKETARLEEMRIAKEEADEANRAKSAFLAVVSHEIRTPMTGVMGMVRLLLDSNISKQQKDYVLTIQESGDAMLSLLNDILDFEKIQRGKMELENISFDLHRLIQGVISLMSGHAAQKKITLSARVDDNLPRFVKGDPTRLRQVLLNLMGNALKFTENGSVTLLIKNLTPAENTNGNEFMIYFAVTDTGIGISETAQKNLFSPFAQADSTIARKFGGTGLGLAISKGLIETMGSTVNINSQPGEGSTFFFTLKMERGISSLQDSAKKAPERVVVPKIDPMRILIVDDNTINRKVISSFLEQDNHILTTSSSGEDALQKIEAQDFDLVLMDIELPGISGNEATKTLRAHTDQRKAKIPVIALTGNIGKDDMGRYVADGMNDLIPKPIDPDQLKIKIYEVVTRSNQREIRSPDIVKTSEPVKAQPAPIAVPAPAPVPFSGDMEILNPEMLQSLKNTIGNDQLQKLLDELIEKTDEILEGLALAARGGNMDLLMARAHELRGMAGNFGLIEISNIAADAERKAKTNEREGLDSLVETLPGANERARNALRTWMAQ